MNGPKFDIATDLHTEAGLNAQSDQKMVTTIAHYYEIECYGPDGTLKWKDTFKNIVTFAGLQKYLDATLKTGLAAPAWYVGLITGPGAGNTYVQADTMAAHAGWTENTSYAEATRQAWTSGAISTGVTPATVNNSASKAIFNVNANVTLAGCFMTDNSTKGGGTGTLLGEGNFTGGDRLVQSGDVLNVAVTATMQ